MEVYTTTLSFAAAIPHRVKKATLTQIINKPARFIVFLLVLNGGFRRVSNKQNIGLTGYIDGDT